jgi:preprotein translocase subunit SecD
LVEFIYILQANSSFDCCPIHMWKTRITALLILIAGIAISYFVIASEPRVKTTLQKSSLASHFAFKLGLDLSGGTHLVYKADISQVAAGDVKSSMDALRDVIERRVNLFGVSEPVVTVEDASFTSGGEERLSIDLPNVTDISKAVEMIGQTPLLEFKTENSKPATPDIKVDADGKATIDGALAMKDKYINTELTGKYLDKAILEFDKTTNQPIVSLQFNSEGSTLFEDITRANVGKTVAIFLDGAPISTPVVREAIAGGRAQISGTFTPTEAKMLVGRLNSGALPVPISLISTQTIGATLGEQAARDGAMAAMIGFMLVGLFLILWYRLPGIIAVLALAIYTAIMLAVFKLIPVTLTAAGIAGFIISIGIAVDANVLIFERIKEELRAGRMVADAVKTGFDRAWSSIRDSNTSSIITALILYWFGTTLIKGFAFTFFLGVVISMISAISISRIFLFALGISKSNKVTGFLFGSGFSSARAKQ